VNILQSLTERIEDYRATNKNPCKNYGTQAAAEKATKVAALKCAKYLGAEESARYVVFFCEPWGRWVGALDFSELLRRPNVGGYIGIASQMGFFSY
jgi:hypothetical protein